MLGAVGERIRRRGDDERERARTDRDDGRAEQQLVVGPPAHREASAAVAASQTAATAIAPRVTPKAAVSTSVSAAATPITAVPYARRTSVRRVAAKDPAPSRATPASTQPTESTSRAMCET